MQSEEIKEIRKIMNVAWKHAYSLPSSGEKTGRETYRLHFKRRHTVERINLFIIRASDLII